MNQKTNITILGATSHIARGLIYQITNQGACGLRLYTRSPEELGRFLGSIGRAPGPDLEVHEGYDDFAAAPHDVLVNCVGVGTVRKLQGDYSRYFAVTELYDNLVIDAMRASCGPDALYISLGSGAVYNTFSAPAEQDTVAQIQVNSLAKEQYYAVCRLNAEAKHRSLPHLSIVDLRIFAYFSRFMDLDDGYFISEALRAILEGRVLEVDASNFVRDYLHPEDLYAMIQRCMEAGRINAAYDVCSSAPVEKQQILDHLGRQHGLQTRVRQELAPPTATGTKNVYCSNNRSAATIGYEPRYSSMDTIAGEARALLDGVEEQTE